MSDDNGGGDQHRSGSEEDVSYKNGELCINQDYGEPMAIINEKSRRPSVTVGQHRNDAAKKQVTAHASRSARLSRDCRISRHEPPFRLLLIPPCMFNNEIYDLAKSGPIDPPITAEHLRELDWSVIRNNISLRVDLHYDHDLHFMPISGCRGEEKRLDAEQYYRCILFELAIYQHNAQARCLACEYCSVDPTYAPSRLSSMFEHLKELLLMLVPEDDHQLIIDNMDIELLLQEVEKSVFDVSAFSTWLRNLLTNHCAPIRDDSATDMAQTMTDAAADGDMPCLVQGLKQLFSFLECMRLDVANHQISVPACLVPLSIANRSTGTFRNLLIEGGVAFQINYFDLRMSQERLNVNGSRQWFHQLCKSHVWPASIAASNGRNVFVEGLIQLCCDKDSIMPITLKHDAARLDAVRVEIRDLINLSLCQQVFQRLVTHLSERLHQQAPNAWLSTSRLMHLLEGGSINQCPALWCERVESLGAEITHQAYQALGISILKSTKVDMFAATTNNLQNLFEAEQQQHRVRDLIAQDLETRVQHWCKTFHSMSALEISELQNRQQQQISEARGAGGGGGGNGGAAVYVPDKEDIARRLAHIAVIHWRVWRGLAYLDAGLCEEFGIDDEGVVVRPSFEVGLGQVLGNGDGGMECCALGGVDHEVGRDEGFEGIGCLQDEDEDNEHEHEHEHGEG